MKCKIKFKEKSKAGFTQKYLLIFFSISIFLCYVSHTFLVNCQCSYSILLFAFEYILFSDYVNYSAGLSRLKRQKHITNQSKCRENSCQETPPLFLEIIKVVQDLKQRLVWNPISSFSLFKIYKFEAQLMKERWFYCSANLSFFLRKNLRQQKDKIDLCFPPSLWSSTGNQIHDEIFVHCPDTIYHLLKDLQKNGNYMMRNILMLSTAGLNLSLVK